MTYAKILATGNYLPQKILSNLDLEKMVDTNDEWIVTRSGISRRHIAAEDETPASMAEIAACRALEMAAIDAKTIDLIIVATVTPEKFLPSTACLLQERLKIPSSCIIFDISAACTGFLYALDIARQYIQNKTVKTALVIGAEILSRAVDWKDRNTCVLFGDGAGAAILGASETPGILGCKLYADGSRHSILEFATGLYHDRGFIQMQGRETFKIAVISMIQAVRELLAEQQISLADIDWIIPHQANSRIIDSVAHKLEIPKEKVVMRVAEHANTSSASIPLAFDDAVRSGMIKRGQTVLLAAFGGGLTWGAAILRY